MANERVFAGVPVTDHEAATAWYARFFSRPADSTPMPGLAEWHLTSQGGIQVFSAAEQAGGGTMTLGVEDIDAYLADLARRDIPAGEITSGAISRFAEVHDPDGNTIMIAETYERPS